MQPTQSRAEQIQNAKNNIKSLSNGKILTRAGIPSQRNLAKPYKAARVVVNKNTGETEVHPMDRMRLTANGKECLSNGCEGVVSTFLGAGATSKWGWKDTSNGRVKFGDDTHKVNDDVKSRIIERKNAIGKIRNPKKIKSSRGIQRMPSIRELTVSTMEKFIKMRNEILTLKWIAEALGRRLESDALLVLDKIEGFILLNDSKKALELDKRDKLAEKSVKGRVLAGQICKLIIPQFFQHRLEITARLLNTGKLV